MVWALANTRYSGEWRLGLTYPYRSGHIQPLGNFIILGAGNETVGDQTFSMETRTISVMLFRSFSAVYNAWYRLLTERR